MREGNAVPLSFLGLEDINSDTFSFNVKACFLACLMAFSSYFNINNNAKLLDLVVRHAALMKIFPLLRSKCIQRS